MADSDSNTNTCAEITYNAAFELDINTLMEMPVSTSMDLFQIINVCQSFADALVENGNITERMALCGRLFAAIEVMKVVLKTPLPEHLVEQLTVEVATSNGYLSPLPTDSETLCSYCSALTIVLLNQQLSSDRLEDITELLFEMLNMLAEDLMAPRFFQDESALVMLGSGDKAFLH